MSAPGRQLRVYACPACGWTAEGNVELGRCPMCHEGLERRQGERRQELRRPVHRRGSGRRLGRPDRRAP